MILEGSDLLEFEKKRIVDSVARTFDRLGLLVRSGYVPVDIIANFYVAPAIRSWKVIFHYVNELRDDRKQPGHLWEFENLIFDVIVPGLKSNDGVWHGVREHDGIVMEELDDMEDMRRSMMRDDVFSPGSRYWEIGRSKFVRS